MKSRDDGGSVDYSRRALVEALAGIGATTVLGASLPGRAFAQDAAKPPPEPPGTIPSAAVMSGKDAAMKAHSERPLTASVTAEYLGDDVTPINRHFIRNNLFTPDFDEAKHTFVKWRAATARTPALPRSSRPRSAKAAWELGDRCPCRPIRKSPRPISSASPTGS